METRRTLIWAVIVVGIFAGLLVDRYMPFSRSAQSQSALTAIRLQRIGVMPFLKGRPGPDLGATLNCAVCELHFDRERVSKDSDLILTR